MKNMLVTVKIRVVESNSAEEYGLEIPGELNYKSDFFDAVDILSRRIMMDSDFKNIPEGITLKDRLEGLAK